MDEDELWHDGEFIFDDFATEKELARETEELFEDYDEEGQELVSEFAEELGADWRTDPDELLDRLEEGEIDPDEVD